MEIIFLVSNIVACAFLMIYHMHMYQLNSYNIMVGYLGFLYL